LSGFVIPFGRDPAPGPVAKRERGLRSQTILLANSSRRPTCVDLGEMRWLGGHEAVGLDDRAEFANRIRSGGKRSSKR
jgi:hypothetical protein